ncbi:MAG: DUF3500 domain-containing protein [Bryobacterales bacterium]|nr:DUF3500 domain-containing protein [Bryobacterales bacterium]
MKPRLLILAVFSFLLGFALFDTNAWSQAPAEGKKERYRQMSVQAEQKGLADPFKGITASGTPQPGLFPIRSSGVSTEPMRKAAGAFLSALTAAQRAKTVFPMDDPEWRKWMNQHFYIRQGVSFDEMNAKQREAAVGLMRASLSAKGLQLTQDIMRLNETLGELNSNNFDDYGEGKYWITMMGQPSAKEPWGWQLDGHHAIVNYFVLGDQVVMTPLFVGSEPVIADSGKYKGTKILQDEQAKGLALVNSLDQAQRARAVLNVSKTGNNNLGEAFKDNVVLDYAGVPAAELNAAQQKQLLDLIGLFVGNMDDGHARVKMDEVRKHLAATRFAWIGASAPESVFYYRIHSPVILVEFDHQLPVGIRHLVPNPRVPFRDHIHIVVRTPNGNDYGKDLLRQHYEKHPHSSTGAE